MKGIILAGGTGSRLYPLTISTSKQLLGIYDKPMIYYPLSTLMMAGIKEVLIITTPQDQKNYIKLLGDGSQVGMKFKYVVQKEPKGLAEAFILGEEFIADSPVCLVLGDNIFYANEFKSILQKAIKKVELEQKAVVFGYKVKDPENYGVVEFDNEKVTSFVEKPKEPKSNYAVMGLYFYPPGVSEKAKKVKPSQRDELEITSINEMYLLEQNIDVIKLGRGFTWLDTGTHSNLMEASLFVSVVEKRQGLKIACIEEIALKNQWINNYEFNQVSEKYGNSEYGQYLKSIT